MAVTKTGKTKRAADYAKEEKQARVDRALAIRAAKDDGPEGEVARSMLAKRQKERGIEDPEGRLAVIATDILSIAKRTIEDEFAIGRLLAEAASVLNPMARKRAENGQQSGSEFTDWFNAQGFPFSMKTAKRLRIAVEREPEVRALIEGKVGRDMGVNTAVAQLLAGQRAVEPTQTEVAKQARKDLQEALRSEDDTKEFIAFEKGARALIDGPQQPLDIMKRVHPLIVELASWYQERKATA